MAQVTQDRLARATAAGVCRVCNQRATFYHQPYADWLCCRCIMFRLINRLCSSELDLAAYWTGRDRCAEDE